MHVWPRWPPYLGSNNMAKPTPRAANPAPAAPAANTQAVVAAATGGPVRVPTVPNVAGTLTILNTKAVFKGARQAWYTSLQGYAGKPVNAWLAHVAANPPSLPASGKPEPVSGWWRYFVRHGIAAAVVAQQAN
jgi:hypothetical protein